MENLKQNPIRLYFKTKTEMEENGTTMERMEPVQRQEPRKMEPIGSKTKPNSNSKQGTKAKHARLGPKVKTLQLQEGLSTLQNFIQTKAKARLERNQNLTQNPSSKDAADFNVKVSKVEEDRGTKCKAGSCAQSNKGSEN